MDEDLEKRAGMACLAPLARRRRRFLVRVALAPLLLAALAAGCGRPAAPEPSLLLFITVDQLRGDHPERLAGGDGGFARLYADGRIYTDVHYGHEATQTATGHATLFTGADPRFHGMVANEWADRVTGERVYCVADPAHRLHGEPTADGDGTSPANLQAPTFGDELIAHSGGASRVFAVSTKDRGAIIPAGRLGKAFWFSKTTGRYVTSDYYYEREPEWLAAFNEDQGAHRFREAVWDLVAPRQRYAALDRDNQPWERDVSGLGRVFPHRLADVEPGAFAAALRYTPFSDELTVDLARLILDEERLGRSGSVDVLAISLSAVDYIGHAFGVESLEAEDNLLRLDRLLDQLLEDIDRRVGLERTLVVLSSDHGVAPTPDFVAALGGRAGRVDVAAMLALARRTLADRFGLPETVVQGFHRPSLYLNRSLLAGRGLDSAAVENHLAEVLRRDIAGIQWVLPRYELAGPPPAAGGDVSLRIWRGFHGDRSGDLVIVPEARWMLHPKAGNYAGMHGTPYAFDTWIPLIIRGPGVVPGQVPDRVDATRIAPTIAMLIGGPPPPAAASAALPGVIASPD